MHGLLLQLVVAGAEGLAAGLDDRELDASVLRGLFGRTCLHDHGLAHADCLGLDEAWVDRVVLLLGVGLQSTSECFGSLPGSRFGFGDVLGQGNALPVYTLSALEYVHPRPKVVERDLGTVLVVAPVARCALLLDEAFPHAPEDDFDHQTG